MSVTKDQVLDELRRVKGPDLESNIVELGLVSEILIKDQRVYFSITVPVERASELEPLRQAAEKVVSEIPGVSGVTAVLTAETSGGRAAPQPRAGGVAEHPRVQQARAAQAAPAAAPRPQAAGGGRQMAGVPGVKHLIAVASGKGGVGKSTTAVNLALGFRAIGLKAGILDADIYGPSQPRLLGLTGRPQVVSGNTLRPMQGYGLQVMSMGFLVDPNQAVIWRGPKVAQAVQSFLGQIPWAPLDYLVIDLPPGTGDAQLTLSQSAPLSGSIVVTTPQDVSLIDARKGVRMFREVKVPVLGVVENMSYFVGENGKREYIFGSGGGRKLAVEAMVPLLAEIPIDPRVAECGDLGEPIVRKYPDTPIAQSYLHLARTVISELARQPQAAPLPEVQL